MEPVAVAQVEPQSAPATVVEQGVNPSPTTMSEAITAGMAQPEPEIQAEVAPQETPVEVASPIQSVEAPAHWPEARRQEFASLPENQQQFMVDTMKSQDADYTRKTQQLSEYRKTISDFVDKLPAQNQQPQPEPVVEIPDDPIDRIRYDATQDALKIMREETQQKEANKRVSDRELLARQIKTKIATDPFREQVQGYLRASAERQPNVICQADPQQRTYQRIELDRLDSDPEYFGAMYLQAREVVAKTTKPAETPAQPQTVTTVSHKPHLERAGVTAPITPPDPKTEKHQQLVRDIRRGKATSSTLGEYLSSVLG